MTTEQTLLLHYNHRTFWNPERKDRLRTALDALWSELDLSYEILRAKIQHGSGRMPAKKTLQNFRSGQTLRRSAWCLSAICQAVLEAATTLPTEHWASEHVGTLADLASELNAYAPARDRVENPGGSELRWSVDQLDMLLRRIPLPGPEIDVKRPEFPPTNPRFPATPIVTMKVRGNDVRIKDESWNWTGSHKDRWAWEQLIIYRGKLNRTVRDARRQNKKYVQVPQVSMISSGSAAFALQALLRLWSLPSLRVLVSKGRIKERYIRSLRAIGAEVYESTLVDEKMLSEADVCLLTENPRLDMDITSRALDDQIAIKYYDWLVCEILIEKPKYIFCPVGTGDLFMSIAKFIEHQLSGGPRDVRIGRLTDSDLRGINILGATTDWSGTNMDKLYARFRPSFEFIKNSVEDLIGRKIVGALSGVFKLEDDSHAIDAEAMARNQGINTEYSGIAGLALLLKLLDEGGITDLRDVIVVNTGWLSPVLGTHAYTED